MKILDKAGGYARRADGMQRAEEGVDEKWYRDALAFIRKYCRTHEEMFCDDLWTAGLEVPREARALGPVIMQAVRDGIIERAGRYRASTGSNMTPKPVWRSLVYEGKPTTWFYVKRRDGKYASGSYRKKDGRWGVHWVSRRAKAERWVVRSEAFDVRKDLRWSRVVSVRVHRITISPLPLAKNAKKRSLPKRAVTAGWRQMTREQQAKALATTRGEKR